MKSYFPFMLSCVSLFVAILALFNSVSRQLPMTDPIIVAGVLRSQDERGWYLIDDQWHTPINIQSIHTENGMIVIRFSKKLSPINTFIAVPDETFANAGFFVGASVNTTEARILISKVHNGKVVRIDASTIKSQLGNIWIYGLFEAN